MKFVEKCLWPVKVSFPSAAGKECDVSDISEILEEDDDALMSVQPDGGVEGWALHIAQQGATEAEMLQMDRYTTVEELECFLNGLPVGCHVVKTLVLEDYTSTVLFRRTVEGFVAVLRTGTGKTEGFTLVMF